MAKLIGVKTIDMVNGEITKVSYNGEEFTKVDGIDCGTKVMDGDIGLIIDSFRYSSLAKGEYYEMIERPDDNDYLRFKSDDSGDENGKLAKCVTVFRNLNAKPAPTPEALDAKVDALDKRVSTLEGSETTPYKTVKRHAKVGERILITAAELARGSYVNGDVLTVTKEYGKSGADVVVQAKGISIGIFDSEYEVIVEKPQAKPTITHNGAEYTLVDHKAQAGDVVVFMESDVSYITVGKSYDTVDRGTQSNLGFYDNSYDDILVYHSDRRTESNVLVYAPVEQPNPKTGDIVVITANTNGSRNKVGDIGKVGEENTLSAKVDVPERPNSPDATGNWTKYSEMRLATPAEIAEYEKAVANAVEIEKWAAIGRKPNEFKEGDIVRVTKYFGGHDIGTIGELVYDSRFGKLRVKAGGDNYSHDDGMELITPAESRFDRT